MSASTNAVTWFLVIKELSNPIATKTLLTSMSPRYDIKVLPQSKGILFVFKSYTAKKYIKVVKKTVITKSIAPMYFPKIICQRAKGLVSNSSRVPVRLSSEKLLIHNAGIKNINSHGLKTKKLFKSAKPELNKLKSVSKNQRNNVVTVMKAPIII